VCDVGIENGIAYFHCYLAVLIYLTGTSMRLRIAICNRYYATTELRNLYYCVRQGATVQM